MRYISGKDYDKFATKVINISALMYIITFTVGLLLYVFPDDFIHSISIIVVLLSFILFIVFPLILLEWKLKHVVEDEDYESVCKDTTK
jgi:hypothetical protein